MYVDQIKYTTIKIGDLLVLGMHISIYAHIVTVALITIFNKCGLPIKVYLQKSVGNLSRKSLKKF